MVSIFGNAGIATSASLINIIKVSIPDLIPYGSLSAGVGVNTPLGSWMQVEGEIKLTRYIDRLDAFSISSGAGLRFPKVPWGKYVPGSFLVLAGLSHSSLLLPVETDAIERSAQLLLYLTLEYDFLLSPSWALFIRDEHRSGIFGLMGDVVGGSDYLCIGVRAFPDFLK